MPAPYRVPPEMLPTPYQAELLIIFMEECCEVAQRASKMARFGAEEVQMGQQLRNNERLMREWYELELVMDLLLEAGMLRHGHGQREGVRQRKMEQLAHYMQNRAPAVMTNT